MALALVLEAAPWVVVEAGFVFPVVVAVTEDVIVAVVGIPVVLSDLAEGVGVVVGGAEHAVFLLAAGQAVLALAPVVAVDEVVAVEQAALLVPVVAVNEAVVVDYAAVGPEAMDRAVILPFLPRGVVFVMDALHRLVLGLPAAMLFVFVPLVPVDESHCTRSVLCTVGTGNCTRDTG